MIIKNYEINDAIIKKSQFILLYGDNQGYKNEIIQKICEKKKSQKFSYYETEILNNPNNFYDTVLTRSFFENEKIIIIKKSSDKIKKIIDEIIEKKIEEIMIIIDAEELTKKSKLRNMFEKETKLVCVPFYSDNSKSLNIILMNFLKEKKISISREIINLLIERSNGSREHLKKELEKIESFLLNKKTLSFEEAQQLTNLSINYHFSELVDHCLAKNKIKLNKIINENNFSNEDVIAIIRVFLTKAKRLYKLKKNCQQNNNVEKAISEFKPPIFWKDRDIIKQQIKNWSEEKIQILLSEINDTELLLKKNFSNSLNILLDFIFSQTEKINN